MDYICRVQGFVLSLPLSQDMVVQKKTTCNFFECAF